jgi:tetratricopeptide (TPR) repeat protein
MESQAAIASLYLASGQPGVSTQFYEQLATAEPQVNRWKMSWATALLAAGKPQDALEQLKIVAETDSANKKKKKNMGDCFFRLDSLFQTFHNYYVALTFYPRNKSLWGTLTRILVTNNQAESAVEVGNEAIKIDATNVEAWKYLGVAYYKLGKASLADIALGNALTLGDSSFTAISHYGVISYHLQDYTEAEKYLEKAYQLDSNDINTMNYLATTYGYTGKSQKGLDILDELDKMVAQFDTIGMKANIQRGYLLRRLNRNQEAANAFITAIKDFPKDIQNIWLVATCYDNAHNKKLAIDWYTRYLEKIDPQWATKRRTKEELKEYEFANYAVDRIKTLKEELFWEGEK